MIVSYYERNDERNFRRRRRKSYHAVHEQRVGPKMIGPK